MQPVLACLQLFSNIILICELAHTLHQKKEWNVQLNLYCLTKPEQAIPLCFGYIIRPLKKLYKQRTALEAPLIINQVTTKKC